MGQSACKRFVFQATCLKQVFGIIMIENIYKPANNRIKTFL